MSRIQRSLQKIFVTNLPWTISSRELRQYFSGYGNVSQAKVVFDKDTGLSKGFGFVTFTSEESVNTVLKIPHHVVEGQTIIIQPTK